MPYYNLCTAMKMKGVTNLQIAKLLQCRPSTVSDKMNGVTISGFTFDEAYLIKKVLLPDYDYEFLFCRTIN